MSMFYYAFQPAQTECVRFGEKRRPVKHLPSDDFSLEPRKVKQARASSPKPSIKRHMSPKGGVSGQARKREGDPSAVSESCDLQVAPSPPPHESKRGQKRSPSGSSVSDDSLSPPPLKVDYRRT